MQIKVLKANTPKPKQAKPQDIGADLYTTEDALIMPNMLKATLIGTNLKVAFSGEDFGLFISPRSSIFKYPLALANSTGLIDGGYRGEIKIPLRNTLSFDPKYSTDRVLKIMPDGSIKRTLLQEVPNSVRGLTKETYLNQQEIIAGKGAISERFKKELFTVYAPLGTVYIPKGTRLVQAYLLPRFDTEWTWEDELPKSDRGANGFGSTGGGKIE